jgi:flagellar biosynthesis protein FliQ
MTPEIAIDLFKNLVGFAVMMIAPLIGTMLVVGLLTSLAQSVTSIQEQTLTFIPKLLALAVILMVSSPWLLRNLTQFAVQMFTRIGSMGA